MELFREDGCLSDEGLHALTAGQLDELGRLEAAEHLAYCDKCTDRYTALLTADALADPPRDVRRTVMSTIWVRLMQSTCGRAAVAGVAAVLALTMWRTGALTFVTDHGSDLQALLPTVQVTLPEKQPPKILPEKLQMHRPLHCTSDRRHRSHRPALDGPLHHGVSSGCG